MTDTATEQTFPPRMIEPMPVHVESVWRVTDVELDDIAWVLPALQKQWPRLDEGQCRNWFKAAIADRYTMFVRTKNVVGMAQFDANVKEPWPVVREIFIRAKEGYEPSEPLMIHRRFAEWAIGISAKEYQFKTDSDRIGNINEIKAMLRKLPKVLGIQSGTYEVATLRE